MTPPATSPIGHVAARLYAAVEPLAYADALNGYATVGHCNAMGTMLEDAAAIGTPDPDVRAPWALVYDLDNCPPEWLPWLGQWNGTRLPEGLTVEAQREAIRQASGFKRGTVGAIIGAGRQYMTDPVAGDVIVRERYNAADPTSTNQAYQLQVRANAADVLDADAFVAAVRAAKPAGLVLDVAVVGGQDWQQVVDDNATWTAVLAAFPTWQDLIDEPIGD